MFTFGSETTANCMPSVTDIGALYPELTLATALFQRAGLSEIFTCPGPFTLLLPTNAAFDALDSVFLEYLLRPENQQALEDVMLYHVLQGSFLSTQFQNGQYQTLLPGESVSVTVSPTTFNNVGASIPDLQACNGVVNAIDGVILPFEPRKCFIF